MRIHGLITILIALGTSSAGGVDKPIETSNVQFFGDTFIPAHAVTKTGSSVSQPNLFKDMESVLQQADWNIVNFEGTVANHPYQKFAQKKRYLLRMPPETPAMLRSAGIQVATLANNHIMDYGLPGLLDSLAALRSAHVYPVGAGRDEEEATRALTLPTLAGDVCLIAVSKTLPENFWAKGRRAGTAHLNHDQLEKKVAECAASHAFTFVTFHWGTELSAKPRLYQRELAHTVINAGATAVIGHHPHVLQEIEIYRNRPIFYSVGNFAFGTLPRSQQQEGLGVRFTLHRGQEFPSFVVTPLQVVTAKTGFKPRPLNANEHDASRRFIPRRYCTWEKEKRHWSCRLPEISIVRS